MQGFVFCFVACLFALVSGDGPPPPPVYKPVPPPIYKSGPPPPPYKPGPPPPYKPAPYPQEPPKPYSFQYGVADDYSGAQFSAQEDSDAKVVSGSYTVALPDGRIQRVTYTVDGYSGYIADVQYEGKAAYPKYEPKPLYNPVPKPIYKPGPPPPPYKPTPYKPKPYDA